MWRARLRPALAACLVLALAGSAQAQDDTPRRMRFNTAVDLSALGVAAAGALLLPVVWAAPEHHRWRRANRFDEPFGLLLGSDAPSRAGKASDVLLHTLTVAAPTLAFSMPWLQTRDRAGARRGAEDAVVVGQAMLVTTLLTSVVKRLAARTRPAVHWDEAGETRWGEALGMRPTQRHTSFFSGHASVSAVAASALVSVGYVRRYPWRHAVAGVSAALAVPVGLLRVRGRYHWLSDVLMGWAVGTVLGVLIPVLAHGPEPQDMP